MMAFSFFRNARCANFVIKEPKEVNTMEYPGFLVLDGYYDDMACESFLYVRPMGTDTLFTVGAIVAGFNEIESVKTKVILVDYMSAGYLSVKPALTAQKSFRHYNRFSGKHLEESASLVTLTGQLTEKLIQKDGSIVYTIDSVFPLRGLFNIDKQKSVKTGDWLELELQLDVLFNKSLTINDWAQLNPDLV
jgi:hypothetical protein